MLNAQVVPFLEVTQVNEIKNLLNDILKESDTIHKSVIVQEIKNLQQKIIEQCKKSTVFRRRQGLMTYEMYQTIFWHAGVLMIIFVVGDVLLL